MPTASSPRRQGSFRFNDDSAWHQAPKDRLPGALTRATSGNTVRHELRAEQDAQQLRTFTRWWNSWLAEIGLKVTDLCNELKPGVYPILLLEVLSDSKCPKFNKKPSTKFQYFENHNIFLQQLKAKSIKIVNIGAEDLAGQVIGGTESSHRKLVLGLTWTLILRYEIHKFGGDERELLKWAQGLGASGGWAQAFANGQIFCAMVHQAEPAAIDLEATKRLADEEAMMTAFEAAETHLGVPQLLEPSDLLGPLPADERSVMLYVAKIKQASDERGNQRQAAAAAAAKEADESARAMAAAEASRADAAAAATAREQTEALLRRVAELRSWAKSATTTFEARIGEGGDALGIDEPATRALLTQHQHEWRVNEKQPRDVERAELTELYSSVAEHLHKLALPSVSTPTLVSRLSSVPRFGAGDATVGSNAAVVAFSTSEPGDVQASTNWFERTFGAVRMATDTSEATPQSLPPRLTSQLSARFLDELSKSSEASPAAVAEVWAALDEAEKAYEHALEQQLLDHETSRRAAETDALASQLREEGAQLLEWMEASRDSMIQQANPAAITTLSAAQVEAAVQALSASLELQAGKEEDKVKVQEGLMQVATRVAAETPGGASWLSDPFIDRLDTEWAAMVTARVTLRRALGERETQLAFIASCQQTDDNIAALIARSHAWMQRVTDATVAMASASSCDGFRQSQGEWAAERNAIEEERVAAEARLAREGRTHQWASDVSAASLSKTWSAFNAALLAREEALLAASRQEEVEAVKRAAAVQEALHEIAEIVPLISSRAAVVEVAEDHAAASAQELQRTLEPWLREHIARLEAKRLEVSGHPQVGEEAAATSEVVPRRRSLKLSPATLQVEAEAVRRFVNDEMAAQKRKLLELREAVHGAISARQVQRFEGFRVLLDTRDTHEGDLEGHPEGLESEVSALARLESAWAALEQETRALQAALVERIQTERGAAQEWGRLRRGCAQLATWFATAQPVISCTALRRHDDTGGNEEVGNQEGKTRDAEDCEPECDVMQMLFEAQLVESQLQVRALEVNGLATIVHALQDDDEFGAGALELFSSVGPPVLQAVGSMRVRIATLKEELQRLQRLRAERLSYEAQLAAFESTVEAALELTSFPVASLDTADRLVAIQKEGNAQAEQMGVQPPEGATTEARATATALIESWRAISPALALRSAACEGAGRTALEATRLYEECTALNQAWLAWRKRVGSLLSPEFARKVVQAGDVQRSAELAAAQLPEGQALHGKASNLRPMLRRLDDSGSGGAPPEVMLPAEEVMADELAHVRACIDRLGALASGAPPLFDPQPLRDALVRLVGAGSIQELPSTLGLSRFIALAGGTVALDTFHPFPLDEASALHDSPQSAPPIDLVSRAAMSRTVIEHVNHVRTQPQLAAAEFKARLMGCFDGNSFSPPWRVSGKPIATQEGEATVAELVHRLEGLPPLQELEQLEALEHAASLLGQELAEGTDRDAASAIEIRLEEYGTWSGVVGEAVVTGMRHPEAIVTMMLLCDGDEKRKNREFLLNPDVRFAAFASTELKDATDRLRTDGREVAGPVGVLSLLSHFYQSLKGELVIEFQGPVDARRRPMPKAMRDVLDAVPSQDACELVLSSLTKGKKVRLEYADKSLAITVTDASGRPAVSRLRWT